MLDLHVIIVMRVGIQIIHSHLFADCKSHENLCSVT